MTGSWEFAPTRTFRSERDFKAPLSARDHTSKTLQFSKWKPTSSRYLNQVHALCELSAFLFIKAVTDGTLRQGIKDADGNIEKAKIRSCSISDPYIIVFREDDTIGLFIDVPEKQRIRRKDMSPLGDKVLSSSPFQLLSHQ